MAPINDSWHLACKFPIRAYTKSNERVYTMFKTMSRCTPKFLFFSQVLTFNVPLTLILGKSLESRRKEVYASYSAKCSKRPSGWQVISSNLPFSLLLVFQVFLTLTEFPRNYGTTALILSPVRGGSVILAIVLLFFVHNVDFRKPCPNIGCMNCK